MVIDGATGRATSTLNELEQPTGDSYHAACWRENPPPGLPPDA